MPLLTLLEWKENGSEKKLRVIDRIASKWEDLGLDGFGFEQHDIDNAKSGTDIKSCRTLIQRVLENGAPKFEKPTWNNLLKAMRRSQLSIVADNLEEALRQCNL